MFRANQTAYLSDVVDGMLGKWGVAREQKTTDVKSDKPSAWADDGKDDATRRRRRRRWRNRRYEGLGIAGSAPLKSGWS